MNSRNIHNFLRRTLLPVAAAGLVAYTLPAQAQVKKTEDNSVLCNSYSSISVSPGGVISIAGCASTSQPPPPVSTTITGDFSIYGANAIDGSKNAFLWYSVARAAKGTGNKGAITINLVSTGGCTLSPASVSFADGSPDNGYQSFAVVAPKNSSGQVYNTTCVVSMQQQNPALSFAPNASLSIAVTGPGTPPPVTSCPAIPADAVQKNLGFQGADQWIMPAGIIGYAPLTDTATFGRNSGRITSNDVTATPSNGLVREISISKCPGVIDTKAGGANNLLMADGTGTCYWTMTGSGSAFNNDWFSAPGPNPAATDDLAKTYHICEAYKSQGQWYLNVRYQYTPASCPWGACGLTIQSNFPQFNP
jgi:hypothetical protein